MNSSTSTQRRTTSILTALYWLVIFGGTHLPPAEVPKLPTSDKTIHTAAYFFLSLLLHWALAVRGYAVARASIMVVVIGLAYGAFDETTQPLVGRSCDLHDWYADALGVIVATVIAVGIRYFAGRRKSDPRIS